MADKKTIKVTKEVEVVEDKEAPKEPESNNIDDRMAALLEDHIRMGARQREEPAKK